MSTVYCTATSLDGYIADDEESLSWLFATSGEAEPTSGAPTKPDPTLPDLRFDRFYSGVGSIVCGVNTFEWVRRDLTKDGRPFVWPYTVPSWVVTHRDLDPVDGVEFFAGDVGDLHPLLVDAADGGDVWVVGGGDLAGQFADRGLLDRVWIHQCPVVLGSGRPLLPRRLRLHRRQLEAHGQFTAMLFDVVGPEPRSIP
ncbi:dihydrofolate reductase [Dietzia sp. UCD-THP]|uniref:dihydrofolate reductase family protein n=1 Tax=Dietzia sp. UCD-THP TaxID=1292020 RepID=UPI00035F8278|nr:dihydrofolate reductase family protein [Dietzia sp. UCD-THP]EYT56978.1 dihydrofolate reductase [Dietzia sp. UCD-THP]MDZ4235284.1 dihydrofolate reductase family protein [Dietzia sp.]